MTQFYSQYAEDRWIVENIAFSAQGYFIDIGACDGVTGSNTKHFEERGWSGLCIEADPRNIPALVQARQSVLWGAVSNEETIRELICNEDVQLTGLKNPANLPEKMRVSVPTIRLQSALEHFHIDKIDLLSIDTEGTEIDVLESFDLNRYKPHILIVEYWTCGVNTKDKLVEFLANYPQYELVHQTTSNLIWSDGYYPRKPRHYKVVEIGVCDFDILSERYTMAPCLLVEPHPYFSQKLREQNRPNWTVVETAIGDQCGVQPFHYMPPADIETYQLDWWMRGASSLAPVSLMRETCQAKNVEHLMKTVDVNVIKLADLFDKYGVQ